MLEATPGTEKRKMGPGRDTKGTPTVSFERKRKRANTCNFRNTRMFVVLFSGLAYSVLKFSELTKPNKNTLVY